jgi:hypothetical protein
VITPTKPEFGEKDEEGAPVGESGAVAIPPFL